MLEALLTAIAGAVAGSIVTAWVSAKRAAQREKYRQRDSFRRLLGEAIAPITASEVPEHISREQLQKLLSDVAIRSRAAAYAGMMEATTGGELRTTLDRYIHYLIQYADGLIDRAQLEDFRREANAEIQRVLMKHDLI